MRQPETVTLNWWEGFYEYRGRSIPKVSARAAPQIVRDALRGLKAVPPAYHATKPERTGIH